MPRPDEQQRGKPVRDNTPDMAPGEETPLSKTRRKAAMHALQDIGEQLVDLEPRQFNALLAAVELPERLRDAIVEARAITAHGGRKRQLQYVGRLMRDVDPAAIVQHLEALAQGRQHDAARQHALERWRDRLLDDPAALDALAGEYPYLDRPRLRSLIGKARDERVRGEPPHAYRDLFRTLKELLDRGDRNADE